MAGRKEYQEAISNLEHAGWKVDYMITHTEADHVIHKIDPMNQHNALMSFWFMLEKKLEHRHWYFGHFHDNREMDEKHTMLYQSIIQINSKH